MCKQFADGTDGTVYNLAVGDSDEVLIVSEPIKIKQLADPAAESFGDMVKGVVDVKRSLLVSRRRASL